MYNPEFVNFIILWVLYPDDDKVYIQNKILFMNENGGKFYESNLHNLIEKREAEYEDGLKISEWVVKKFIWSYFSKIWLV